MTMSETRVNLRVNGQEHSAYCEARLLLVDFLRQKASLTGTHLGCAHGVCGACTVQIDGRTARSCLHFAIDVQGSEIRTVEDLATESRLHVLQQAFHEHHALQCGFCTPGFLMTAEEFLRGNTNPSDDEIRQAIANNICRCTGYGNIVKAIAAAARQLRMTPKEEQNG